MEVGRIGLVGPAECQGWIHSSGSDGSGGGALSSSEYKGCEDLAPGHQLQASWTLGEGGSPGEPTGCEGGIPAAHLIDGETASRSQLGGHSRDPNLYPISPGVLGRFPEVGPQWSTPLPPRFREQDPLRGQDQGAKLFL